MQLAVILISVGLVIVAQVLLKIGASAVGVVDAETLRKPVALALRVVRVPGVILGLGLYVASAALWIYVLSVTPLSYAYPFLGLSYAGVAITAVFYLKERFTTLQWIGLVVVVIGVAVVAATG